MAKKSVVKFVCNNCGAIHSSWMGRCSSCGEWNTLVEQLDLAVASSQGRRLTTAKVQDVANPAAMMSTRFWAAVLCLVVSVY
jgi:predicted ATP-dependent serine protease